MNEIKFKTEKFDDIRSAAAYAATVNGTVYPKKDGYVVVGWKKDPHKAEEIELQDAIEKLEKLKREPISLEMSENAAYRKAAIQTIKHLLILAEKPLPTALKELCKYVEYLVNAYEITGKDLK